MPKDQIRPPGRFPVWMQLRYAEALKAPEEWHVAFECWTKRMADSEMRGFRAFRRSVRDPAHAGWAKTIRADAQEFVSRARVVEEPTVHQGVAKIRRTIEVICYKGVPPQTLRNQRADFLRKFGGVLGLDADDLPPESGK